MPTIQGSQGSLLNRSPHSRKSLATISRIASPIKRKRAHSIAPGENFQLEARRRRSSLRPSKGILKPFNQADVTQDSFQDDYNTLNTIKKPDSNFFSDNSDITRTAALGDFQTNVHDNTSRKSLGGRRVSFAATAHVRVFDSADQNANETPSPVSSPASSPVTASAPQQTGYDLHPTHEAINLLHNDTPQSPSRRAGSGSRRRSNVRNFNDEADGEGETSMDVSNDELPEPVIAPVHASAPRNTSYNHEVHEDLSEDELDELNKNEDDIDNGDMSMTGDFGAGIISRRQTVTADGGRKSRMRSSIAIPPSEAGIIPTDFVVSMDRPRVENDTFRALEAMVNGGKQHHPDDDDDEVDMDVTTAVTRLLAVRNSSGGKFDGNNATEASFTTTEDSFDGIDVGDRTMNMITLTGGFNARDHVLDDDCDVTMSVASVVGGHISSAAPSVAGDDVPFKPPSSIPEFALTSSATSLPVPVFTKSSGAPPQAISSTGASAPKHTIVCSVSPNKPPIKQFTAAFAPSTQVAKRTLSQDRNSGVSPNKKRAVATSETSSQQIPIPVKSVLAAPIPHLSEPSSPKKPPSATGRRPSGYYRKSLAGIGADVETNNPSPSAGQRHRSVSQITRPPSSIKKATVIPPVKGDSHASTVSSEKGKVDQSSVSSSTNESDSAPTHTRSTGTVTSPNNVIHPYDIEGSMVSIPVQSSNPSEWVLAVGAADTVPEVDELEPISVDQFFSMTGIRFMDDLTCPRRSTMHPSQLQQQELNDGEEEVFPFAAYAVAMAIDLAQLETMSWIANDIRSAINKYKAQYRQTEEDAAKDMPFLFREYATSAEEDREQILYVLKLIKAHTILSAKASWYEWKRGWVQDLQTNAERTLDNLDADERQLTDIADRAGKSLPCLQNEYDAIMQELKLERAAVADIENCDQAFLSELKSTIAEQRQELDVYRNDITDSSSKVARLEVTLEDLAAEVIHAKKAISTAQRQMDMQKTSTRAEVFRLRDELHNLQDLHLWRATQLGTELVEFVYDSKYRVIIPCRRSSPRPEALDIIPFDITMNDNDDFPLLTGYMFGLARRYAIQKDSKLTLRTILQRLTDFWASYSQVRWQLNFLVIKYPISCRLLQAGDSGGFEAIATLLLLQKTSKVLITFHFKDEMLGNWPAAINSLHYAVSVIYGQVDSKGVREAIQTRLLETNAEANHACLVDACMEVVSRYS